MMRLLELVPCGARRAAAAATEDGPEEPISASIAPAAFGLVEKRRRRTASGSSAPWRPSLRSISEDAVVVKIAAAGKGAERTGRSGASRTRSAARDPRRRERDDYRSYGVPPVVPAFTPTAFLF